MMTLIDGKFFNDGQPYPLEFGNKEQIKLIDTVSLFKNDGVIPTLIFDEAKSFICGLNLKCVCGGEAKLLWETESESYETDGTIVKCSGCSYKYKVCSDEDNFLFYKLIN